MNTDVYYNHFYFLHTNGDKLFPCKVKDRDTGQLSFRLSYGGQNGNTKENTLFVNDEKELLRLILKERMLVRVKDPETKRQGLMGLGRREIQKIVFC